MLQGPRLLKEHEAWQTQNVGLGRLQDAPGFELEKCLREGAGAPAESVFLTLWAFLGGGLGGSAKLVDGTVPCPGGHWAGASLGA